jgi:hypothetical protein
MTTYHRYLIADGGTATMDELRQCLQASNPAYDIDGELITRNGEGIGVLIDITQRGDPIFDGDIDLLKSRANNETHSRDLHLKMDKSTCMVTTQIASRCDETALETLWRWLRRNKKGILAYEGGGFHIDQ